MADSSKIYIYCIISSNKLDENLQIKGFCKNPLYCIPLHDIAAVACDFTGTIPDVNICAEEHEKVVESLMDKYTVLPMRLQTIFKTRENVISSLEKHYNDFVDNIIRLSGKLEYGIKVIWPVDRIKEEIIKDKDIEDSHLSGNTPASKYLQKKYTEYKIDKALKKKAEEYISEIDKYLSGIAIEKKLQKLPTEKLFLNVAYLIDKSQKSETLKVFKKMKEDMKELEFLFSGPWPAYNFIRLKG